LSRLPSSDHSTRSGPDLRPLVVRTGGSAIEAVYGLILATSVIAVSYGASDAGRVASAVLVTAVAFSLAHVYAHLLGRGVSEGRGPTRAEIAGALREHWSLVAVVVPLGLVLCLGSVGVIPDRAAIVAATAVALVELAAAGAYAAVISGGRPPRVILSAAVALALGLLVVLLKVLVH
jgi:hypothetical protein